MKKYSFLFLCIFLLSACDYYGETTFRKYTSFSVSFLPDSIKDNYEVIFNGEKVESGSVYVFIDNSTGKLEVYEDGKSEADFSQEVTIEGGENFQFIKIGEKPIDLFGEDKYTSFTYNIVYSNSEEENLYHAQFKGIEINKGENYLSLEDGLVGTLEIFKEGVTEAVFSKEIEIVPQGNVNLIQLGADFLFAPDDTEPAPESDRYTRLRFFYTSDGLSKELVKLIVYASPSTTEKTLVKQIGEFELKPGEISSYLTVDWDEGYNGEPVLKIRYDIIDLNTNTVIIDHTTKGNASIVAKKYKYATGRIKVSGALIAAEQSFCTEW